MQRIDSYEKATAEIGSREELIHLLSRAAGLEHNLACVYLFTAFSLKANSQEGDLTSDEATIHLRKEQQANSSSCASVLHHPS